MIGSAAFASLLAASRGVTMAQAFDGAPGVAYDFTTTAGLTQGRGGLTPVSAAAQNIGLAHDYSRANGGWVGSEMVVNGGFDTNTNWALASGASITGGQLVIDPSAGGLPATASSGSNAVAGRAYLVSWTVTNVTAAGGGVSMRFGNALTVQFPQTTGVFSEVVVATTADRLAVVKRGAANWGGSIDNISVREITGNPLIAPTDARRGTWATMPNGLPCLALNGTSHAYATAAAVNPGANDEVHVWAAVRKLSGAASRVLIEASASSGTNPGTFAIFAPGAPGVDPYVSRSRGTADAVLSVAGVTPDTAMLYVRGKISTPFLEFVRNGVSTQLLTSQGTGNYSSYVLNVGARNAATASLFFQGDIARLAVLYGPLSAQRKAIIDSLIARGFAAS